MDASPKFNPLPHFASPLSSCAHSLDFVLFVFHVQKNFIFAKETFGKKGVFVEGERENSSLHSKYMFVSYPTLYLFEAVPQS